MGSQGGCSSGRGRRRRLQHAAAALLFLLCAICGQPRPVAGYPALFVQGSYANGCTAHPAAALGAHKAPQPDSSTAFALTAPGSAAPAKSLCRGVTYDLAVTYGTARRKTLLTASLGRLGSSGELPADPACPGRAASANSGGTGSTYTNTLTIPCDAQGDSVQLKVTSSGGSTDAFHTAATTLPLAAASACPGSTCPGAPPAAAAKAAAATPAKAPAAAAAAPAPAAAASKAALVAPAAGCGPGASPYGYACSTPLGSGATLHYSLSDSPTPPDNACTAAATAPAAAAATAQQQQWLHMLLASPLRGYSGLSFAQRHGAMSPADAVIGYPSADGGRPMVSAYHLTDYSVQPSATNGNGLGWASNMGAAAAAGNGGGSLLCFSRPLEAASASVSRTLDPKALQVNWAINGATDLAASHSSSGGLQLNAADGSAHAVEGSGGGKAAARVAHGALMLVAFAALMPLGALLGRHKWVCGDKEAGNIKPAWFHAHRLVQTAAVVLAVAGFILALVKFNIPWSNMGSTPTPNPAYNAHRVLGVIVVALSLLQIVGGMIRPPLSHSNRLRWRAGHLLSGWLTILAGAVAVLTGCVLMHAMAGAPYVAWLLPAVLLLGLAATAGVVGEVAKMRLECRGHYEARSHSFGPGSVTKAAAQGAASKLTQQLATDGESSAASSNGRSNGHVV